MSSPMNLFLRYAFPCAYVLLGLRRMTQEQYDSLERAALEGRDLPLSFVEPLFPAAFRRLRIVADSLGKHYFDPETIRKYFLSDHNDFIDRGDGTYGSAPQWFCEYCKVIESSVDDVKTLEGKLYAKISGGRWVYCPFFSVKDGDVVRVHHSYAVEKVG